jgi:trimethylamine:corrinoid methyltransferase-like protein
MLSLLFAAAEPSKVPFYIAGAVLVVWAVALAGIGLTQPEFPGNERGARGVMTISVVLVVITILAAILTDP